MRPKSERLKLLAIELRNWDAFDPRDRELLDRRPNRARNALRRARKLMRYGPRVIDGLGLTFNAYTDEYQIRVCDEEAFLEGSK